MPEPIRVEVFRAGQDGYHTYRIPSLLTTPSGAVLAICEGRRDSASDTGRIALVCRRSEDGGLSWGPLQVIAADGPNTMGNPCPVVDKDTGTIWLPITRNLGHDAESRIIDGTSEGSREVWMCHSTDDGLTWSGPVEITATTKRPEWTWYATGPGVGIQLDSGRMVVPCDFVEAASRTHGSHIIYSDDHGESWVLGGVVGAEVNECQVIQREDGALLINMRNHDGRSGAHYRAIAISADEGMTWSSVSHDKALLEPVCQASLIRYTSIASHGRSRVLFSNPASVARERMTVRLSYDDGASWPVGRLLWEGPAAYSCLGVLPGMRIGCLYERGVERPYETITLAAFDLDWLTDGEDGL